MIIWSRDYYPIARIFVPVFSIVLLLCGLFHSDIFINGWQKRKVQSQKLLIKYNSFDGNEVRS